MAPVLAREALQARRRGPDDCARKQPPHSPPNVPPTAMAAARARLTGHDGSHCACASCPRPPNRRPYGWNHVPRRGQCDSPLPHPPRGPSAAATWYSPLPCLCRLLPLRACAPAAPPSSRCRASPRLKSRGAFPASPRGCAPARRAAPRVSAARRRRRRESRGRCRRLAGGGCRRRCEGKRGSRRHDLCFGELHQPYPSGGRKRPGEGLGAAGTGTGLPSPSRPRA